MTIKNPLNDVWDEQLLFNRLFRETPPLTWSEKASQTRNMAAGMVEEIGELLQTIHYKPHRNHPTLMNAAATADQLSDIFKYWISMCLIHGIDPDKAIAGFWRKSMVCRQRHSQEWVMSLDKPSVLIDIDGVLCNYAYGLQTYLEWRLHDSEQGSLSEIFHTATQENRKVNRRDLGITAKEWTQLKHEFRSSGMKSTMMAFDDVRPFLSRIRDNKLQIILLTSRPIDRYPNMFADTLHWLQACNLPYDHVWWSQNKADYVSNTEAFDHIAFAVDDDLHYVRELSEAGIPTYWLCRPPGRLDTWPEIDQINNVTAVSSLSDIDISKQG